MNSLTPPLILPDPHTDNKKKLRNRIIGTFSLFVGGVFLYFALRNLEWASFWNILQNGDYKIMALLLTVGCFNYLLRALRWRILLQSEGYIPVQEVFWANMIGYLGNAYLPVRGGEFMRSAFLGKQSGMGTSFVLATAFTERIMDALALVLIGSISLVFQPEIVGPILIAIKTVAVAASIGLLAIFLVPFLESHITHSLYLLPLSVGLREKVIQQFQRFMVGMRSLQSVRRFSLFIFFTIVIWLIEGLVTMVGVGIIGQSLNLGQALIFLSAVGLASAIPSTPGYVGVFQFIAVLVLVPFGFSQAEALAYIIIIQISGYIIVTLLGLMGLWRTSRS